ncbi:hypothetical protein ACH5RR_034731 [Cinchona calisaya]|uniref:Uncharacterized protein n=1 Tax=Cinchona calisaya TaxID=153742 RepID=A0ABD2YCB9_9GENT
MALKAVDPIDSSMEAVFCCRKHINVVAVYMGGSFPVEQRDLHARWAFVSKRLKDIQKCSQLVCRPGLLEAAGSDKETQAMEESSKHKNVMDTMYCFPNRTSGIEIPTPIDAAAGMIGDACFIAGVENVAIGQG